MNKKIIDTLRWFAVLPSSLLSAILAMIAIGVMQLIANFMAYGFRIFSTDFIPNGFGILYQDDVGWGCIEIGQFLFTYIAFGYVFLAAGVYVAPSYKKATAITLLVVMTVLLTLLSAFSLMGHSYQVPIGSLIAIGTAISYICTTEFEKE